MAMDSTEAGGDPISDDNFILVVDDDERTSRLERFVLEEEGYSVALAGSGEEALKILKTASPSLILLDIKLPKMDGLATCQKIREDSQVPIIILTGEGRDEEKIRGLEMGADDYITKPFSVNELTARAKAVLRRSGPSPSKTEEDLPSVKTSGGDGFRSEEISEKSSDEETAVGVGADSDESGTKEEHYEGAVKLVVKTTGAIKDMVDFVDALRDHPQFHLLRMVSNARRDGMDVWRCGPLFWPQKG